MSLENWEPMQLLKWSCTINQWTHTHTHTHQHIPWIRTQHTLIYIYTHTHYTLCTEQTCTHRQTERQRERHTLTLLRVKLIMLTKPLPDWGPDAVDCLCAARHCVFVPPAEIRLHYSPLRPWTATLMSLFKCEPFTCKLYFHHTFNCCM